MPFTATAESTCQPCRATRSNHKAALTDAELMAGLQRSADSSLLAELVRRHQGMLFGFLVKLARDREIAADLCQQTWLKLLEVARSGGYRPCAGTAFRSFLFTVARNQYIDVHVRSNAVSRIEYLGQREFDAVAPGRAGPDDVEQTVHLRQLRTHLTAALNTLPTTQRRAVELWAAGNTAEAAARSLAVPRNTLLSRKKYAFAKLRLALEARGVGAELVGAG
jgi:RNA polymerase sigma-70 factor (ECF subfamily)